MPRLKDVRFTIRLGRRGAEATGGNGESSRHPGYELMIIYLSMVWRSIYIYTYIYIHTYIHTYIHAATGGVGESSQHSGYE